MEESLAELSELAGAAGTFDVTLKRMKANRFFLSPGLTVVGSTYQRVQSPNIEYYIGQGKTKDIAK